MSTLTKVLIILVTVSSMVLCGGVVVYVGSAQNYKSMYEAERRRASSAQQEKESAQDDLRNATSKFDNDLAVARKEAAQNKADLAKVQSELDQSRVTLTQLTQQVESMGSLAKASEISAQQQTKLFENAQASLDEIRSEKITLEKQLKETNDALIEKLAISSTQSQTIRKLTEEKAEIQSKLDQLLRQYGKALIQPTPATKIPSVVQPATPVAKNVSLKGVITQVDLEHRLAEINLGAVDGVREKMNFLVTRGDKFVCNIVVSDVDAERSVGTLKLIETSPAPGDLASTTY